MVLTFEKIREIQMKEKEESKLQELPPGFYSELKEYMESKDDEIIKNVVMDFLERRLRKILILAPSYIKTNIYPKNLTDEEKWLFEKIINLIQDFNNLSFKFEQKEIKENEDYKDDKVIITQDLPTFVWRDLKYYTLKKGEKISLPNDLKDFLIKHGCCRPCD
jgi:DNA replication initiation complex subunit (GINS family)